MFPARKKLATCHAEVDQLAATVGRLKSSAETTRQHVQELELTLRDEQADHAETRTLLDETMAELGTLREHLQRERVSGEDFQRKLKVARNHNAELTAELTKLKQEAQTGRVNLQGEIADLRARANEQRAAADMLRLDNSRLEKAADKAIAELDAANATAAEYLAALTVANETNDTLNAQLLIAEDPIKAALTGAEKPLTLAEIEELTGKTFGWQAVKERIDVRTIKGDDKVNRYQLVEPPSQRLERGEQ